MFWSQRPWEDDLAVAQAVCDEINIPLHIVHLTDAYWQRVVTHCVGEIRSGRTPNPDMLCNSRIKFGAFYDHLDFTHFDRVASGHYARVIRSPPPGRSHPGESVAVRLVLSADEVRYHLRRLKTLYSFDCVASGHYARVVPSLTDPSQPGQSAAAVRLVLSADEVKDQTYFLSHLSQQQLSRVMFPLGALTKVRQLAAAFNLPNQSRKDSQGICFLGKVRPGEGTAWGRYGLGKVRPGEGTAWGRYGLGKVRPGKVTAWGRYGLGKVRPGEGTAWGRYGLGKVRPGEGTAWGRYGLGKVRPGEGTAWGRYSLGKVRPGEGTAWGGYGLGRVRPGEGTAWGRYGLGKVRAGEGTAWGRYGLGKVRPGEGTTWGRYGLGKVKFPEFVARHVGEQEGLLVKFPEFVVRHVGEQEGLLVKFHEFVARHVGEQEGLLVEAESGEALGAHRGFWFFTIGQRQGIKLSGGPW
ncbi:unnamed protein product [Closterium sp. NIES-65]|nr:unnamed protein product [Closterium sp. NIES-65]